MNIADLILALKQGEDPNAAILASIQAPAPGGGAFPAVQPPGDDVAPIPAASVPPPPAPAAAPPATGIPPALAAMAGVGSPKPPAPAPASTAPQGVATPITNPAPAQEMPRIMQSPPDLSNMYIELIKNNQNAAALDSGMSLIAAGFSKYPEIRSGLIAAAGNQAGKQNLTSQDIVNLQGLRMKNQALQIRQAAKAGLMKQYGLSRDTVDYLDTNDKLDEVIKHRETGTLQVVTNGDTGQVSLWNSNTHRKIADVGGPKPEEGEYVDTPEGRRLMSKRTGQPMGEAVGAKPEEGEYVDTPEGRRLMSKRTGQPMGEAVGRLSTEDERTFADINAGRRAAGKPEVTREEYITTIKRDPRAAANEQDVLNLAAINKGRDPDKQMTMEHYLTKVKSRGTTVNVGPQGQQFPAPDAGHDYKRNEDGTVWVNPDTKLPEQVPIPGSMGGDKATSAAMGAKKLTREETEAQEKKNKARWNQVRTSSTVIDATDRALGLVDKPGATGVLAPMSRMLGFIGGKPSDDYDSAVSTIKANTAFAELQRLRDASVGGASGLGSVTDFEQKMLTDAITDLRSMQSTPSAEKALIRVKAMFKTLLEQRFEEKPGEDAKSKFDAALKKNEDELTVEQANKTKAGPRTFKNITVREK